MLYLQKNKITKIENLSHLKQLKKLYLSCNKISVIENLEDLTKLEGMYCLDGHFFYNLVLSALFLARKNQNDLADFKIFINFCFLNGEKISLLSEGTLIIP